MDKTKAHKHPDKRVCVDVDATIAHYDGWKGVDDIGDPLPGAKEFLRALKDRGYHIVVYTTRTAPTANQGYTAKELALKIMQYFMEHDLVADEVWAAAGKPTADFYVDDRAVRCRPQDDSKAYKKALELIK